MFFFGAITHIDWDAKYPSHMTVDCHDVRMHANNQQLLIHPLYDHLRSVFVELADFVIMLTVMTIMMIVMEILILCTIITIAKQIEKIEWNGIDSSLDLHRSA